MVELSNIFQRLMRFCLSEGGLFVGPIKVLSYLPIAIDEKNKKFILNKKRVAIVY